MLMVIFILLIFGLFITLSGVYFLQDTMVVGGGDKNGCWRKKLRIREKGKRKKEKGEKRLKNDINTAQKRIFKG